MRYRTFILLPFLVLAASHAIASSLSSDMSDDLATDGKGIITDYGNMQQGDDINWYWVAPNAKLADDRCSLGSFKNLTTSVDHSLRGVVKDDLPVALKRSCSQKSAAGLLRVNVAVYHVEHASAGKAWIPFAGAHLAQAEVCMEFVFHNDSDKVVGKIRHCAREGRELSSAADEVLDDVGTFIRGH